MSTLRFVRDNARWLSAGILLTWSSSFGQTYFISLSAGHIRETFALSHGEWGAVYTIGTVVSALTLVQIGWLADRMRVRALSVFVLTGFIAMCIAMAVNESWIGLVVIIAGLRLCGQGMMSHLALTAMGRWFRAQRGRAVAIGSLGFALGEAILPMIFVLVSAWIGWRGSWILAAISLGCFTLPLLLVLLSKERTPQSIAEAESSTGLGGRHWRRDEAMRHWLIWALLPGILAPSFMITSLFFHQVHIVDVKGWTLSNYVTVYPLYSGVAVACNLFAGQAIDRYGSARLLPFLLLPMAVGLALYGTFDAILGRVGWTVGDRGVPGMRPRRARLDLGRVLRHQQSRRDPFAGHRFHCRSIRPRTRHHWMADRWRHRYRNAVHCHGGLSRRCERIFIFRAPCRRNPTLFWITAGPNTVNACPLSQKTMYAVAQRRNRICNNYFLTIIE